MTKKYTLAGEGALFVQPDGPNTQPQFLGCHELGDIDEPLGDVKLLYCSNTEVKNEWEVIGGFQSAPGAVSTSLTTDLLPTADYMELLRCPAGMYFMHNDCGKKNVFNNWDRGFIAQRTWVTKRGVSKFAVKDPDSQDRTSQTFDLTVEKLLRAFKMKASTIEVTETEDLLDISFCDAPQCEGDCGATKAAGDNLFVVGGVQAGSPINTADLLKGAKGLDGNFTWTFGSTDPFGAAEIIASVRCVEIDADTTRIYVLRGTADAGNPMEIAWSDDGGLTWTHVNIGSVNNQYALGAKSMYVMDAYNIWVVTSGGYIYHTIDGGVTWHAESSGGLTAQNLTGIEFYGSDYGYAVGEDNVVLKTMDGGASWAAVTGPTGQASDHILTLQVLSDLRVWIGYNDGKLYYTHDGGDTWAERSFTGAGTGEVKAMDWLDVYIGMIVHNDALGVGHVLMTVNGGFNWKAISLPANAGLNSIVMCSPMLAYAVGDAYSGSAVVMKLFGG